jgi:hypothetical protein
LLQRLSHPSLPPRFRLAWVGFAPTLYAIMAVAEEEIGGDSF